MWTQDETDFANNLIQNLLHGVGVRNREHMEVGDYCIHWRRQATMKEVLMTSQYIEGRKGTR